MIHQSDHETAHQISQSAADHKIQDLGLKDFALLDETVEIQSAHSQQCQKEAEKVNDHPMMTRSAYLPFSTVPKRLSNP